MLHAGTSPLRQRQNTHANEGFHGRHLHRRIDDVFGISMHFIIFHKLNQLNQIMQIIWKNPKKSLEKSLKYFI